MLENWLEPVRKSLFDEVSEKSSASMARKLSVYTHRVPDLRNHRVALIGGDGEAADLIRKELYSFSCPFPEQVADLGNVRSSRPEFLVALLKELLEGDVMPVLLGGSRELVSAQVQAYYEARQKINLAIVDNRIRYDADAGETHLLLNKFLGTGSSRIFLCSVVGYQRHLVDSSVLAHFDEHFHEHISLGHAREDIRQVEPVIRDADVLSMHIPAFAATELPARSEPSSTGMTVEEGCRICRYAGMSDRLSSLSFPGMDASLPGAMLTANAIAQMVWYFLEGVFQRKNEYPRSVEGLVEYVVQLDEVDMPVSFWKSPRSGRWWMEAPTGKGKSPLTACSYEDYLQTSQGDIPSRLLKAMYRYSG